MSRWIRVYLSDVGPTKVILFNGLEKKVQALNMSIKLCIFFVCSLFTDISVKQTGFNFESDWIEFTTGMVPFSTDQDLILGSKTL